MRRLGGVRRVGVKIQGMERGVATTKLLLTKSGKASYATFSDDSNEEKQMSLFSKPFTCCSTVQYV